MSEAVSDALETCRVSGHELRTWDDIQARAHVWQHGDNPEARLTFADADILTRSMNGSYLPDLTAWLERIHDYERPAPPEGITPQD